MLANPHTAFYRLPNSKGTDLFSVPWYCEIVWVPLLIWELSPPIGELTNTRPSNQSIGLISSNFFIFFFLYSFSFLFSSYIFSPLSGAEKRLTSRSPYFTSLSKFNLLKCMLTSWVESREHISASDTQRNKLEKAPVIFRVLHSRLYEFHEWLRTVGTVIHHQAFDTWTLPSKKYLKDTIWTTAQQVSW